MVIIEGCDNTGKTRLANCLASHLSCRVIKSPGHTTREHMATWVLVQLQSEEKLIYDRFPIISESIYGPIIRDKSEFDYYDTETLLKLLRQKNPLIIHCEPPIDKILDFKDRDQMDGVKAKAMALVDKYRYFMWLLQSRGFLVWKYNFMDEPLSTEMVLGLVTGYWENWSK